MTKWGGSRVKQTRKHYWFNIEVLLTSGRRTVYRYFATCEAHAKERALTGYPESDKDPAVKVYGVTCYYGWGE